MYVCMYVCMYVLTFVCMYVCMYVRLYILRMYVCTYVYVYIFTTSGHYCKRYFLGIYDNKKSISVGSVHYGYGIMGVL